jgi:serine/threonine protein kinase
VPPAPTPPPLPKLPKVPDIDTKQVATVVNSFLAKTNAKVKVNRGNWWSLVLAPTGLVAAASLALGFSSLAGSSPALLVLSKSFIYAISATAFKLVAAAGFFVPALVVTALFSLGLYLKARSSKKAEAKADLAKAREELRVLISSDQTREALALYVKTLSSGEKTKVLDAFAPGQRKELTLTIPGAYALVEEFGSKSLDEIRMDAKFDLTGLEELIKDPMLVGSQIKRELEHIRDILTKAANEDSATSMMADFLREGAEMLCDAPLFQRDLADLIAALGGSTTQSELIKIRDTLVVVRQAKELVNDARDKGLEAVKDDPGFSRDNLNRLGGNAALEKLKVQKELLALRDSLEHLRAAYAINEEYKKQGSAALKSNADFKRRLESSISTLTNDPALRTAGIKGQLESVRAAIAASVPPPPEPPADPNQAKLIAIAVRVINRNNYTPDTAGLIAAYEDLSFVTQKAPADLELRSKIIDLIRDLSKSLDLLTSAQTPAKETREYFILPITPEIEERVGRLSKDGSISMPKIKNACWVGAGGMGEVYKALDPQTGEYVAIKVLTELSGSARFESEYRTMLRASDLDSVVKVYAMGGYTMPSASSGRVTFPFMVQEFMDFPTLASYEKKLDPKQVIDIAIKICEAMFALHSKEIETDEGKTKKGIFHRDLKPSNIFFDIKTGRVKIGDFGLAKEFAAGKGTQTGTLPGTLAFMAPCFIDWGNLPRKDLEKAEEMARRVLTDNDIFAVGGIIYKLLTGVNLTWTGDKPDDKGRLQFRAYTDASPTAQERNKDAKPLGYAEFVGDWTDFKRAVKEKDQGTIERIEGKYTLVKTVQGVDIPEPLYQVIALMVAYDPRKPYSNFIEVKSDLERIKGGLAPIGAQDASDPSRSSIIDPADIEVIAAKRAAPPPPPPARPRSLRLGKPPEAPPAAPAAAPAEAPALTSWSKVPIPEMTKDEAVSYLKKLSSGQIEIESLEQLREQEDLVMTLSRKHGLTELKRRAMMFLSYIEESLNEGQEEKK